MPNTEPDGYDLRAVRSVYEDMAADYAVRFGAELREPDPDTEFLDAALADLPDGPVLDVGCGPAQVSGYLIAHGRTAIGLDIAPGMLAAAARLVPEAGLIAADLLALPLRTATCAGAVASYSLHHLPRARLGGALAGLARVLRPGGVLVVITHGGGGEEWLDMAGGKVVLSTYSLDELTGMLSYCGLKPELTRVRPPREGEYPADKIRISARAIRPILTDAAYRC
ncbi:MAG: class I SAM-dependent methyltransferase [Streptosporangiaceae bacterium]